MHGATHYLYTFVHLEAAIHRHSFLPGVKIYLQRFSIFYKNVLRKKTFGMRDYRILHEVTVLYKNYVRFHPHKK